MKSFLLLIVFVVGLGILAILGAGLWQWAKKHQNYGWYVIAVACVLGFFQHPALGITAGLFWYAIYYFSNKADNNNNNTT